jgi:hypothetical protein
MGFIEFVVPQPPQVTERGGMETHERQPVALAALRVHKTTAKHCGKIGEQ